MIFKLDMMKAFDRVSWGFIRSLLLKFGLHGFVVDLIINNLSSSCCSILVSGSCSGFFQPKRGLKQGDPLLPILFILLTEALTCGIKDLVAEGRFAPYTMLRGVPVVSHMCFADDLILFTKGFRRPLQSLFQFLASYERLSGKKINKDKSFFLASKHCSVL